MFGFLSVKYLKELSTLEQYSLSLQISSFEYLHYHIQHSFCVPNDKCSIRAPADNKIYLHQARLSATKSVLVFLCVLAHALSGAPWVRKFGNLCIREILIVT